MSHVMSDLETLDLTPNAIILSLGAVAFELEIPFDNEGNPGFYANLDLTSQMQLGRTMSSDTFLWWMKQSKAAQMAIVDASRFEVVSVIEDFLTFCDDNKCKYSWGNGNMFDTAMLQSLFTMYGYEWPFKFWNDFDLRTMRLAAGSPKKTSFTTKQVAHNALDDATRQVLDLQNYWRIVNGQKA